MGLGFLTVKTVLANGAVPIAGAKVVIKDNNGYLLYSLVTNDVGKTGIARLPAPDKGYSLDPSFTGTPYSTYRVEVEAEGYVSDVVNGVQVFDTEEAVVEVGMHPFLEGENPRHVVNIPPHQLASNEPIRQIGPPRPQAGKAMQKVVIPDFITVHLGRYNVSARNVRVPFPFYVKNCASSEIYPTWPDASLEANIRAIINFALNRIYTEWYRGRNYPFDITNSTTTDMAFEEGRDIFPSIAVVVDRVMGMYLRRPQHNEPFFTEFCDGRIATCPGMKQWGTVTLAENGYTPLQILRYYYPNDLSIFSAPTASISESFPGVALSQGKQGPDVHLMQQYLNRIRQDFPLIPNIEIVNGIYSTETVNAVRTFQRIFELPQTGIIDRATWNSISWYYVAVTKLAELTSQGDQVVGSTLPPNTVISLGASGGLVARLQYMLTYIAQFYPDVQEVAQDGSFGSGTRAAVISFQNRFGLNPEGIVDPATWIKLYEVYHLVKGTEPPIGPGPGPGPGPGAGDPVIRNIQSTLNQRYGFNLTVDGIFGRATKTAIVMGLQTELNRQFGRNLVVDGVFGPMTRAATVNVRPGARGNMTYLIQAALYTRGYTSVIPDGVFGPGTETAVRQFQRAQGLTADGIVGPMTQDRLFR